MSEPQSPTLARLEDQISWYGRSSTSAQRWFKTLKVLQLLVAGIIPLLTIFALPQAAQISALLGLLVLVIEGLQQLNQYQSNWFSYRSTSEALKHEKYLFIAGAGPYAGQSNPLPLLADRIEGLIAKEHTKWQATQQQRASTPGAAGGKP